MQGFSADLVAERLRLAQWRGRDGLGYELRADLKDINSSVLKDYLPKDGISRVSAIAHVNAAGALIDDILIVSEGLELRASGTVKGNLLADRNLGIGFATEFEWRCSNDQDILSSGTSRCRRSRQIQRSIKRQSQRSRSHREKRKG